MIKVWELWYANFPLEEDVTIFISRPVIVLSVNPLEILTVKVTSKDVRINDRFDTPIQEWASANLKSPSVARISKTIFLTPDKLTKKIGILHDTDKANILAKYTDYLNLN